MQFVRGLTGINFNLWFMIYLYILILQNRLILGTIVSIYFYVLWSEVDKFTLLNHPESYSNNISHWCIYLAKPIPLLLVMCLFLDISFLELMIICENEWCCSFWTLIPIIEGFSQSIPSLWWHRLYKSIHSNSFWLVKHFYTLITQMI